ncbi:hypothetical protein R1flu_028476 [Riccia fluitans]|uniref:Secreted protein n=1 Tax=Riccia fluitans TaxID=41844 RepID=A0ABD1XMF3_9MARC
MRLQSVPIVWSLFHCECRCDETRRLTLEQGVGVSSDLLDNHGRSDRGRSVEGSSPCVFLFALLRVGGVFLHRGPAVWQEWLTWLSGSPRILEK